MGVYFYPHLFDVDTFATGCTAADLARLDRLAAGVTIDTGPDTLSEEDRALVDGIVEAVAVAQVELDDDAQIFREWEGTRDLFGRVRGDLRDGDELDTVLGCAHRLAMTRSGIEGFLLPGEIDRAVDLLRGRGPGDEDSGALVELLGTAATSGHGLAWWWT